MEDTIIKIMNTSKYYGKGESLFPALDNINIEVMKGEMLSITGHSGSGKSTLLNIIGLLDNISEGEYILNNRCVKNLSMKEKAYLRNDMFGFIVQDFALIEKYNVFQNVEIPLTYSNKKLSNKDKKDLIESTLKKLGIEDKMYEFTYNLSGGQRQRVAIARALVNNPEIILADEPTGALDTKNTESIMEIFHHLNQEGKTLIIVTHNEDIANSCHRKIKLKDGKIV